MFSKVNGGLEQVFLNYTPGLISQGNEVIPIIHPKAEIKDQCTQNNLVTLHNFNQHDFIALFRLRRFLKREKPDCIITHSYRAAYLFNKTKTKIPKIAVCHVKGHYDFGSDAIIALTEHMRQHIIATGVPEHTVFTVPNMIALPKHLKYKKPKVTKVPIIGVCARFADIKGVDLFIHALAKLKKRKIPFLAKIAGDGKERERYEHMIVELNLSDDVELLGWITDTQSFYKSIDLFCLPSREEAFGLVVLESMMHSLPMVLSALSGPIDIVGNSNCALMVPPCDPLAMADGIERIISEPELAQQLSLNAFNRVNDFSMEHIAPKLQRVVEQVCALRRD